MTMRAVVWVALFSVLMYGCTISPIPNDTPVSLISADAPIFDNRFKNLTRKDLDLSHFWLEYEPIEPRNTILLHRHTFADITDAVKAGVVNIYTLRLEERDIIFGISPNDLLPIRIPLVSDLFEIIPFQVPIPVNTKGMSLGSGFILNPMGYILTNAHVVQNALDIQVLLADGTKPYPAKIIGIDRLTDIALIKIEPDVPLTALPLGNSDELRTAEMVLAIGNPLGLTHTVTSGLISAKERMMSSLGDKYAMFLQIDSAINPGSSGGPLLNLRGEVVGINTALASNAQLIGFAIPINTVKEVMPMLVLGQTERGWFGAGVRPIGVQEADKDPRLGASALVVQNVEPHSPAEASGLHVNDIIVKMNDRPIENFVVFRRRLLGLMPETTITLTILRDGKEISIASTLVKRDS